MSLNLNPEKARIFRIVHVDNVPWILDHDGLHCRSSATSNPNYVDIGNPDLISKRASHPVGIPPGGVLGDYLPFYFTPFSIMMYNIHTGRGVRQRPNREIVIFVSSLHRLVELEVPFLFTDQHAYAAGTSYFSDLSSLDRIDWALLQSQNFKTDDRDPGKGLRYQAEALVHQHLPLAALLGICCHNDSVKAHMETQLDKRGLKIGVKTAPHLYF